MRVLVVEDERKLANVLASALSTDEYDVTTTSDGDEGLERATTEAFDAVVLDLMLPGRSGLEILQALRHRKNGLDVVAIHHHMVGTTPTIYFLHYWGTGPAEKLATGFKAALSETGKASKSPSTKQ